MAVDEESEATICSGVMALLSLEVWSPGLVTLTTLETLQVKLAVFE